MKNIKRVQICNGFEYNNIIDTSRLHLNIHDTFMFDPDFKLTGAKHVIPCRMGASSDLPTYDIISLDYFNINYIYSWPITQSTPTCVLDKGVISINNFKTLTDRLRYSFNKEGGGSIKHFPKMAKFIYSLMGKGNFYLVLDLDKWDFMTLNNDGFFTKYFRNMNTCAYTNIDTGSEMILVSLERPKVKSLGHHLAAEPNPDSFIISAKSPTGNCQIQLAYPGYWEDEDIEMRCQGLTGKPLLMGVVQSMNKRIPWIYAKVALPDGREVIIAEK